MLFFLLRNLALMIIKVMLRNALVRIAVHWVGARSTVVGDVLLRGFEADVNSFLVL